MSTGTLVRAPELIRERWADSTADVATPTVPPGEGVRPQLVGGGAGPGLFYRTPNTLFADATHFITAFPKGMPNRSSSDWDTVLGEVVGTRPTVWETSKLQQLLMDPVGAPIDLTVEEADEIVRLAAGRRPDLPVGKEFTKEVRELLGHSLMDRLKKAD